MTLISYRQRFNGMRGRRREGRATGSIWEARLQGGAPFSRQMKESIKSVGFLILAHIGEWFSRTGIPILTYHSLDESRSTVSMSPTAFRRQMRYLKDQGFTSIRLSDLVTSLKSNLALPGRAFVLTFDDGFKNVYQIAFPLLQELGFTATIFLVTDYIGQRASWELGERDRKAGVQHFPLLSWAEIKEMHRYGFTFGAHGAGHLPLTRLPARQVRSDVEKSKRIIEDELGTDCQLFCYPYGDYNQVVRGIVQETGFEGAVTTEFGRNGSGADLYALRRIGSAHFTTIPVFRACLYGTYGWHLRRRKTRFPQRG